LFFDSITTPAAKPDRSSGCFLPYSGCQKKRSDIQTFFSTTVHALIPQFRNCVILNIIMESGIESCKLYAFIYIGTVLSLY